MAALRLGIVALLATVAFGTRLETLFDIPMPSPVTTWGGEPSTIPTTYIGGDMAYVIAQGQDTINAVNLTGRKVQWQKVNISMISTIQGLAASQSTVLAQFASHIRAFSAADGTHLWSATGYTLIQPSLAVEVGSTIYAVVNTPLNLYALVGFDRASGAVKSSEYIQSVVLDGNTLFINKESYNANTGLLTYTGFVARDITTWTDKWSTGPLLQNQGTYPAVKAASYNHVLVSNLSGTDTVGMVLDRSTGAVLYSFEAFNGIDEQMITSPPKFLNGKLFALVGIQNPRYILIDLSTGYIIWTRSFAELGSAVLSGTNLISISANLVLTIADITGSAPPMTIPQVPSLPTPSIISYGESIVQVSNLQGFTLWDAKTATYLGRDETIPGAGAPLAWNGAFIFTSGSHILGLKLQK